MKPLFIEYPPCSTCRKAKHFLVEHGIEFEDRHIVECTPTIEELRIWLERSTLDIAKFFNTSGRVYKEEALKDKLKTMSEDEKLAILASNGMVIKRPILVVEDQVLVGFREEDYRKAFHIGG